MNHLQDFIDTAQAVEQENQERERVRMSEEFRMLELEAQQITEKKAQLLFGIPDSTEELDLCKKALIEELTKEGKTEVDGLVVKVRKNKRVDTQILLEKLEGDFDAWRTIIEQSPPSQKAIKDFVKDNPEYKRAKFAIVEDGETIADISLPPAE